jgi:hypothetical protein
MTKPLPPEVRTWGTRLPATAHGAAAAGQRPLLLIQRIDEGIRQPAATSCGRTYCTLTATPPSPQRGGQAPMPVWPRFSQSASTHSGDWWRPFFVTDTDGFTVLVEDWVVGGTTDTDADDVAAAVSFTAAVGGTAALAFAQRVCEHAARYAQQQAENPAPCRYGCAACRCSCGPSCAARYFDLKQALLQTVAFALHILVVLACVSFNVWIFSGCCAGVLAGELIGSSCKKRLMQRDLAAGGSYEMVDVHDGDAFDDDVDQGRGSSSSSSNSSVRRPMEPGSVLS